MPPPTRQQRRAADRRPQDDREGLLRLLFSGLLLAVILGFGWWLWTQTQSLAAVREGAPSWSPDSRQIVFYSERDGKADIWVTDVAGRDRRQLTNTPKSGEGSPAFSPDGKLIAFDSDADGNFDIYVMSADGSGPRRLTDHPARDLAPAWTPDGRQILFMSTRDNPKFDIYRMDSDGKNVERLTKGSSNWFPQVSPDGTRLAMHVMRDVHVMNLKTLDVKRVTFEPLNGMYPTWSADGSQIAFMSSRNGRTEIFTAKASGADQQLLVTMPTGDAIDPRWSPDGEYIAFVHVPSGGVADAQHAGQERILYVVDVRTKRVMKLS